jgi:TPR repeat protein
MKFVLIIGVMLAVVSPAHADFQDGWAASLRGDYATAMQEWLPLAEQGDAKAQNNLGFLYNFGRGVAQDYAEAAKWYRLAAEQGNANAQYNLGVFYEQGRGVSQDTAAATKW